jgi:hypothetical protein
MHYSNCQQIEASLNQAAQQSTIRTKMEAGKCCC